MSEKVESYRLYVPLTGDELAFLDELAQGIGCSRAAIGAYLLNDAIRELMVVPARSRAKIYRDCRSLLWGSELAVAGSMACTGLERTRVEAEAVAAKALRARGVSGRYIGAVLRTMMERVRHAAAY